VDRNPDGSVKVIQTVRSWNSGERPEVDEHAPTDQPRDQGSHGTRVASLALGATYGIAKHATLVSVKSRVIKGAVDDQSYALQLVLRDIIDNNRQNQAVVLSTIGDLGPSPRNAHETDYSAAWYHFGVFRELMKLGVPVITPSGNDRNGNSRAEIDFWPSMWASPEYPLIVVGETDHEGIRPPVSQAGPQVTTWAPGSGAICVARDGSVDASAGSSLGTCSKLLPEHGLGANKNIQLLQWLLVLLQPLWPTTKNRGEPASKV
jgi:hypothetical protein